MDSKCFILFFTFIHYITSEKTFVIEFSTPTSYHEPIDVYKGELLNVIVNYNCKQNETGVASCLINNSKYIIERNSNKVASISLIVDSKHNGTWQCLLGEINEKKFFIDVNVRDSNIATNWYLIISIICGVAVLIITIQSAIIIYYRKKSKRNKSFKNLIARKEYTRTSCDSTSNEERDRYTKTVSGVKTQPAFSPETHDSNIYESIDMQMEAEYMEINLRDEVEMKPNLEKYKKIKEPLKDNVKASAAMPTTVICELKEITKTKMRSGS